MPRPSHAQEPAAPVFIAFEYAAPAACMSERQALSLLHRRSRRVVRVGDSLAHQHLDMSVVSDVSGYRGVLTVTRAGRAPERRTMTGGSCDEVVEALALTAALSIDPEATVTLGPETPAPSRDRDNAASEPSARQRDVSDEREFEPDAAPSSAQRAGADLQLTLGPTVTAARLMDHAMHVGGGVLLAVSRLDRTTWLPLEARVSVYALTESAAARGPVVKTSFVGSRLAYCPVRIGGDQSLLLCPVSQMGVLSAESQGFEDGSTATRFFVTLGLEAWARARISRRVDLWLSPSLERPLTRRQFGVEPGPEILASSSALSWSVSAGIGWNF